MLSIELMLEMGRRLQPDGGWWKSETGALAHESARMAAYCLDAPDDIPAGGMYSDQVDDMPLPMPMMAPREAIGGGHE